MLSGGVEAGAALSMPGEACPNSAKTSSNPPKDKATAKIVQIDLDGIISSFSSEGLFSEAMPSIESLKRQLAQAAADAGGEAIVLRINSPGGEVTASDVLYNAVKSGSGEAGGRSHGLGGGERGYYVPAEPPRSSRARQRSPAALVIMESINYADLFGKGDWA